MEEEISIHIAGMVYNQSLGGTFSLVLSEDSGLKRRFSVLIGEAEAQSIALKINNAKAPRPLTHDLTISAIEQLGGHLIKAVIYKMEKDIFYSELYIKQGEQIIIIDSRTSDAVALAVRSNAPLYIKSAILDIVGMPTGEMKQVSDELQEETEKKGMAQLKKKPFNELTVSQLQTLLDKAVSEERYEDAAIIRDEIEKRK